MKGHDALCPTAFPHLKDRKHCAYCNLIEVVRDDYKERHPKSSGRSYEDGYKDGLAAAVNAVRGEQK